MVSRGETSRHRCHFRTVFYRSKRVSSYVETKFRVRVLGDLEHADVHFILYFADQDAHSARGSSGVFGMPSVNWGGLERCVRSGSLHWGDVSRSICGLSCLTRIKVL